MHLHQHLKVKVLDPDGVPAPGATVRFEVLNMAEMMPIGIFTADENGEVSLDLGRGQVRIHALNADGSEMAETDYLVTEDALQETTIQLTSPEAGKVQDAWEAFDFYAPIDYPVNPGILSDNEKKERSDRMERGNQIRLARIDSFYEKENP